MYGEMHVSNKHCPPSVTCGHAFDRTFEALYLKFDERNELKTILLLLFIAGLYTAHFHKSTHQSGLSTDLMTQRHENYFLALVWAH